MKEWRKIKQKTKRITNQKAEIQTDSSSQSNARPSRSRWTRSLSSCSCSWPSLCGCCSWLFLPHSGSALVESRRSVQLACLPLPRTPRFYSCWERCLLQGALQGCEENYASASRSELKFREFVSVTNMTMWCFTIYDAPYLALGVEIHVGNSQ